MSCGYNKLYSLIMGPSKAHHFSCHSVGSKRHCFRIVTFKAHTFFKKIIMFLIMGNIHVIGPQKLLTEPLAHWKMINLIVSFWSIYFLALWNVKSYLLRFFGPSWRLLVWTDCLTSHFTENYTGHWCIQYMTPPLLTSVHLGQPFCCLEVSSLPKENRACWPKNVPVSYLDHLLLVPFRSPPVSILLTGTHCLVLFYLQALFCLKDF